MQQRTRSLLGALILVTFGLFLTLWHFAGNPKVRSRQNLIRFKMGGAVPREGWSQIIGRLMPARFGGAVLHGLPMVNPRNSPKDIEIGRELYAEHCDQCHGSEGQGASGPAISGPVFHELVDDLHLFRVVSEGIQDQSMPPFSGSMTEALQITAFLRSLSDGVASGTERRGRPVGCDPCRAINVSPERLNSAVSDAANWITYSHDYTGQRFSTLDQISVDSVSRLHLNWIYRTRLAGMTQTTPLVVDGVMLLTGADNEVVALDAGTGKPFWIFARLIAPDVKVCCGRNNRGVAVLGNRVYHATLDSHLIALDLATGEPVWDVTVADVAKGYSMTGAPLAVKDMLIVGVAGAEYAIRGFIAAYDAETGEEVWRFHTVPAPGEPGHETWENDAWKTGGGSTWVTGSYDPELDLLYWGVGNPFPGFDGDVRPGDNLYTTSVVALDPDTGELEWHYQFVPHDVNDWDAAIVPVLADLDYRGELRKLMLWAHRNCFFYLLDRETGEFLQATEYCRQTWNDGFTREGRPLRRPNSTPTTEGIVVHPSVPGGSNWYSPAFSPITQLYYVTYRSATYIVNKRFDSLKPGTPETGGVRAIDVRTGKVVWEHPFDRPSVAGLIATATGLVFTGTADGDLLVLDAANGEELLRTPLGASIDAAPITYLQDGRQQLAVVSRGAVIVMEAKD